MNYDKPKERAKAGARRLRLAQKNVLKALQEVSELNPKLNSIEMRATSKRSINGQVKLGCVIIVVGDDQNEADRHCLEMADQGCSCQSTGPSTCECDCDDVGI